MTARGATGDPATRTIRVAERRVDLVGEPGLVALALGPLLTLEDDDPPSTSTSLVVRVARATTRTPRPPPGTPAVDAVRFHEDASGARVSAPGVGVATLRADGAVDVAVDPAAPHGDALAEIVVIPALAERLRRESVLLLHAAVLLAPPVGRGRAAWLIPADRGAGKTTLSLSLRREGFSLLSDDRGWLSFPGERAHVDPWPEAPRVGDRSLFLLPRDVVPGLRDARTGKAPVPALVPPRLTRSVPVAGILLPRLVEGSGGRVEPSRGAASLAALVAQAVVATSPTTAREALRRVASLAAAVPAFHVHVGDDPRALAEAVLDAIRAIDAASRPRETSQP